MTFKKKGETVVLSPLRRLLHVALAVVFLLSATAFATPPELYSVTIIDGGDIITVETAKTKGEDVLKEVDIVVNEAYGDSVSFKNFTGKDGSAIIIKRGVKVTINNFDGTQYTIHASGTVKDAIEAAGLTLRQGTALNYSAADVIEEGMVIEIYDIYKLKVTDGEKTIEQTVSGKTVADALDILDITLGENDYSEPSTDTNLKNGMSIEIFRVEIKERKETRTIKFKTEYTETSNLYKDEKKVVTKGVDGSKAVVYEDFYVNGELKSSTVVSTNVTKEPVNEKIEKGTKARPVSKPVSTPTSGKAPSGNAYSAPASLPVGSPISELPVPSRIQIGSNGIPTGAKSAIRAKATAYCTPGQLTSTGQVCRTGFIAVDPKEIPYGTEMYIVSADGRYVYGYCIAADTGGFVNSVDWTVDLYMNSEAQCKTWGRRDIVIYFI